MQVSRMVDVQVVCKVTDPEVLLRGETKRFTNQVTLQTTDGQNINTATSPADITAQKIDKSMAATNPVSEKVNFTIEANQLGQTLPTVEGTTLKLIDKMSSTLILDTTTILSSGFEILFEKSPKRIAVRKVNQATSASLQRCRGQGLSSLDLPQNLNQIGRSSSSVTSCPFSIGFSTSGKVQYQRKPSFTERTPAFFLDFL